MIALPDPSAAVRSVSRSVRSASLTTPYSSRLSAGSSRAVVEWRLPDDRVEEVARRRHPAARRHGRVALRKDEGVAPLVDGGAEVLRHEHLEAVRGGPRPPAVVAEAEHRLPADDPVDVDAHRVLEVLVEQAEHLIRLVHLHGPTARARSARAGLPPLTRGSRSPASHRSRPGYDPVGDGRAQPVLDPATPTSRVALVPSSRHPSTARMLGRSYETTPVSGESTRSLVQQPELAAAGVGGSRSWRQPELAALRIAVCSLDQFAPADSGPWHTASTLLPSGSRTNAPK